MAVRVGDNLKPSNDSTEFPVAFGDVIWLNKDKTGATNNFDSLQNMYNNSELGDGGSAIQVDLLPHPSVDELGKIYEFIGSTGTYVNGYFYECVSDGETPPTYSWVQKNVQPSNATATDVSYDNTISGLTATNVQDAIDEIHGGLGTASGKNFTDLVRPNSHELVESGSVYSAINNALSSIYTPRGELTCAELTSSLLIEDNVGNIYTMSDSGTTSALFINGAGLTINIGDNVGIIKAGADTYLFNYMGNAFDLTDYQKKELTTSVLGETTVEGALGAIESKDKRIYIGHKSDWDLLSTAEKTEYDEAHFDDDDETSPTQVVDVVEDGDMHAVTSNAVYDIMPKYSKVTGSGTINVYTTLTEEPTIFIDIPAGKMCLVVGTAVFNTSRPLACAVGIAGTVPTDTFAFIAYSPESAHCIGFYKNGTTNTVRLTFYAKYDVAGAMNGEYNTIEVVWLN